MPKGLTNHRITCPYCGKEGRVGAMRTHIKYVHEDKPEERFWAKVNKADGDACWIWQGARSSVSGYGTFRYRQQNINAHRAAWILTHGPIESSEIDVLHTCHNGHIGCVRPDHLYLGDAKQNMADAKRCGRTYCGERNLHAKLSEAQAREILSLRGKARPRELAIVYGVGEGAITAIWSGRSWPHIQDQDMRKALGYA